MLGEDVDDANVNLRVLMEPWNGQVDGHRRGRVQLSEAPCSDPPTGSRASRPRSSRGEEIIWFTRGIDAGGDDPAEFGLAGEKLLHQLGEAGAFCQAYEACSSASRTPRTRSASTPGPHWSSFAVPSR